MHRLVSILLTVVVGLWVVPLAACSSDSPDEARRQSPGREKPGHRISLTFNGGPSGGTFNFFANKMSSVIMNETGWMSVTPKMSGGSLSNICALNLGQSDMAIAYAGDAFLARNGRLECQEGPLSEFRSLAHLYGAPAQLVVRRDSDIRSVQDLKGKIVAVGNPGSGAHLAAMRFFKHLGLWDGMDHRDQGYSQAAADFKAGKVDAFWVLVGYPNPSVIDASTHTPVRLIDLHEASACSGFYDLFPFYTHVEIPAGTYEGQTDSVSTFQDSAIWCSSVQLDEKTVYSSLAAVFSEKGLAEMRKAHEAARSMSVEHGLDNLSIPLHSGAVRFWSDMGLDIPSILLPH